MAVTIHGITNIDGDATKSYEFCGLSTDSKPSFINDKPVEVNSLFLELNTGDFYYLAQQGSKSETILVAEQTFTPVKVDDTNFYEAIISETAINSDTIIVYYDGVKYSCTKAEDEDIEGYLSYGAEPSDDGFDFSVYPFSIGSMEGNGTLVDASTGDEHTIKISAESITSATWSKVGA